MANSEISKELHDAIRHVTGGIKVARRQFVKMEIRTERFEKKALAFSACRLFIVNAKSPFKLEHKFHYLNINAIESRRPNQLTIRLNGEKIFSFRTLDSDSEDVNLMIIHIGTALKTIFPNTAIERLIPRIEVSPPERISTMYSIFRDIEARDPGPCGGFSNMYKCMCDLHHLPYREEVAWDVDTIYLSHNSKELSLQDFDHLNPRDLIPIIAALEYNPWFTKVIAKGNKLLPEASDQLLQVMKKTYAIEEIVLDGVGIKGDFAQQLSIALTSNGNCPLKGLDLSNNQIEDRGLNHLGGPLSKASHGLVHLNLSKTGISSKGINCLAQTLSFNKVTPNTLKYLNLADNPLRGEEPQYFFNFLCQPNALTHLDLSGTEISLENTFNALKHGSAATLHNLILDRNPFSLKRTRDPNVQPSFMHFFQRTSALKKLSLSDCKLPPEALKKLLLGLSCNETLRDLEIILSNNELKQTGADVIAALIAEVRCIGKLDVSDNGMEDALPRMLKHMAENKGIKHISIGKNFSAKPKHIPRQVQAIVELIQDEHSSLTSLSLADSKLRHETCIVVNALGSAHNLESLDLTGNSMGDAVARMLSKALQINNQLTSLYLDRNDLTGQGFQDIATALEKNYTLKVMPISVIDAANAIKLQPQKTEEALRRIEDSLLRNQNPRSQKFKSDQAYRLQQGFIVSFSQQMVDKLQIKTLDTVNSMRHQGQLSTEDEAVVDVAERVCRDAENAKQLLPKLQAIGLKWEAPGNPIEQCLAKASTDITRLICEQMEECVGSLFDVVSSSMPEIMRQDLMEELSNNCRQKYIIPKDFIDREFINHLYRTIMNKMSELNFNTSANLTDRVIDEALEALNISHSRLTNLVNLKKKHCRDGSMASMDSISTDCNTSISSGKDSPNPSFNPPSCESLVDSPSLPSNESLDDSASLDLDLNAETKDLSVKSSAKLAPENEEKLHLTQDDNADVNGNPKTSQHQLSPAPMTPTRRAPKPPRKTAFQESEKPTTTAADWRNYTLTRKSRPKSSVVHNTSVDVDTHSTSSLENLPVGLNENDSNDGHDITPSLPTTNGAHQSASSHNFQSRSASTAEVEDKSQAGSSLTVTPTTVGPLCGSPDAGSLMASVMGVLDSTSGEISLNGVKVAVPPASPTSLVTSEFDKPSADPQLPLPSPLSVLPPLDSHQPLVHAGKGRAHPTKNCKITKAVNIPAGVDVNDGDVGQKDVENFYSGRPPPPPPEDDIQLVNGLQLSPAMRIGQHGNSSESLNASDESKKGRSWWPFKSKEKKRDSLPETRGDEELNWHNGPGSSVAIMAVAPVSAAPAAAFNSNASPSATTAPDLTAKKCFAPPAPPTSPPPDDEEEYDRPSRPASKVAAPASFPGGVLAEMKGKRGFQNRIQESEPTKEPSEESDTKDITRPLFGPGLLKPTAGPRSRIPEEYSSEKDVAKPFGPQMLKPTGSKPVATPLVGVGVRPVLPLKPNKLLKPATAPKPGCKPQFPSPTSSDYNFSKPQFPSPTSTSPTQLVCQNDLISPPTKRPVSSPSPPRPLPRASLATISGGQTTPNATTPIPSHQQNSLQAISESLNATDAYPSTNIYPNRDTNSQSGHGDAIGPTDSDGDRNLNSTPSSAPISPRIGGRQKGVPFASNSGVSSAALHLDVSARNNYLPPMKRKQNTNANNIESSVSLDSLDSGVVISDNSKLGESAENCHPSSHHLSQHHLQQRQNQNPKLPRSSQNPSQFFDHSSSVDSFPRGEDTVGLPGPFQGIMSNPSSLSICIPSSADATSPASPKLAFSVESASGLSPSPAGSFDKDRSTPDYLGSGFASPRRGSGEMFFSTQCNDNQQRPQPQYRGSPCSHPQLHAGWSHRRHPAIKRQNSSVSGGSWGGLTLDSTAFAGASNTNPDEEDEVYL